MSEKWDALHALYVEARESGGSEGSELFRVGLRKQFSDVGRSRSECEWLEDSLTDDERKWLVALAATRAPHHVARELFDALVRAAVYERNPSFNRVFIDPCVRSVGWQRTAQALLSYVRDGTDFEKAGAVNALYWASGRTTRSIMEDPVPDPAVSEGESPRATWDRIQTVLLKEFVRNLNLDVRRSIVAHLRDPSDYPDGLRGLAEEAHRIALSHPDDYIRSRAEIRELGRQGKKVEFSPLPHRAPLVEE